MLIAALVLGGIVLTIYQTMLSSLRGISTDRLNGAKRHLTLDLPERLCQEQSDIEVWSGPAVCCGILAFATHSLRTGSARTLHCVQESRQLVNLGRPALGEAHYELHRALDDWPTPDIEEHLARLLDHPEIEDLARAARTLEMRGGAAAEAILSRHRAFERRRAGAQLPRAETLTRATGAELARVERTVPDLARRFDDEPCTVVLPDTGTPHVAAALGNLILEHGRRVLYRPARHRQGRTATLISSPLARAAGSAQVQELPVS